MKRLIKALYKIDKNMASKVASVFGLKIAAGKWGINFSGWDDGDYETDESGIDVLMGRGRYDWQAAAGLYRENNRKNYSIDNATEYHKGFLKALSDIIKKHPEIKEYVVRFDSPKWFTVNELLNKASKKFNWKNITFYHGTSTGVYDKFIKTQGLNPRKLTKQDPTYGDRVGAKPGSDEAVYLTTQENMAHFAASDAAMKDGTERIMLKISGKDLDSKRCGPDEDSRKRTAEESLQSLGSIAYYGIILANKIKVIKRSF